MTGETASAIRRSQQLVGSGVALRLAGVRYWTASVLPALAGTTLPFWLRPRRFAFRWPSAQEFLFAAALVHSRFSVRRRSSEVMADFIDEH